MSFKRIAFFSLILFFSSALFSFFAMEIRSLAGLSGVAGPVNVSDDALSSFFDEFFSFPVVLSRLDENIFLIKFMDHSDVDVWRIINDSQRVPGFSLYSLVILRGSEDRLYNVDLTLLGN